MERILITVTYNPGIFAADDIAQLFIVNVQDEGNADEMELHNKAAEMFMDYVTREFPKWKVRSIVPVPVISVEANGKEVVSPINHVSHG